MFESNDVNMTKAAFLAGIPVTSIDPTVGTGVYIYKMINGPNASNVYYGVLKITSIVPGVSITFDYRISDQYAHLLIIS